MHNGANKMLKKLLKRRLKSRFWVIQIPNMNDGYNFVYPLDPRTPLVILYPKS